ncbi:hypothetical protein QA640_25125 [Bradyrhizobium sp. CB82]|uniref:hypothetical protein n=1 Tax=Bradyrhizobium sp. CB82 TaxID=3039159 RepID=UPI0024B0F091|nr:hypothetical protein [Bradyrhizobium sp. CB82]WFU37746.1 hypothetical protein QA640_25125 [Bradyrhizobium sp. CB82]
MTVFVKSPPDCYGLDVVSATMVPVLLVPPDCPSNTVLVELFGVAMPITVLPGLFVDDSVTRFVQELFFRWRCEPPQDRWSAQLAVRN